MNRVPPSDPNPPFIEELPDEESSAPQRLQLPTMLMNRK
jgi:hypothetical protein